MFSRENMAVLEPLIRSRASKILDELPRGEPFDFVDRVAVELTSQMLATLFDYPFEQRRKLPRCSDLILAVPEFGGIVDSEEQRQRELFEILNPFVDLWNDRLAKPPANDLISMLAHGEATYRATPDSWVGNVILLIVAGSDTTRHSITGGLLALNRFPAEYEKLRANPALIESMVPEIIRWQSPVAHMRRTALSDAEIGGKKIRKGDKVVMWYVSGNRDEDILEEPDKLVIDRVRPRQHVSFGFGIHRCVGQRLAEMQLRVMWEEILKRYAFIEVLGEPRRMRSNFVKGYEAMTVRIAA
jgi:cytochrome P450